MDIVDIPEQAYDPYQAPYCTTCGELVLLLEHTVRRSVLTRPEGLGTYYWVHASDFPPLPETPKHPINVIWRPVTPVCDFCDAPATWQYETVPVPTEEDAVLMSPDGKQAISPSAAANDTPWNVCAPCAAFIEEKNWDGLLGHVVASTGENSPFYGHTQRIFKSGYTGKRTLLMGPPS